jgi:RHS repeat-associated protein
MVRHGWLNRGDGGFVHVEHDALVDGSMLLADEHSQVLYRKRMCRDAGITGDFYGDCPRDADRYRWSMEADLAVDLDLDGYSDLWTFGLARDDAERTRTLGDLTYWTRSEYPDQPTLNGRLLSVGEDGVFRERTSPGLPSIVRGSALVSEGRYEDQSARSRVTRVLDANGDGAPDVLLADVATRAEGLYFDGTRSSARLMINRRARRERVVEVVNGLGERSTVEYRPMSDATVYVYDPACERESDASMACLTGTSSLVARVTTSGAASDRVTTYRYWDGRSATNGRGFLGFAKVAVTDQATGRVSTYRFDRRYAHVRTTFYTTRRPVHVTHLVQGRNLKHGGDSSRTIGTELRYDYELHTHGTRRWSTVLTQQEVRQFEDVRYYPLDPYADEPFAGLTPVHTGTTAYTYRDDVPWSQRDLPFRTASAVDVDRDPAREYSEREYEPEPTIRPGDLSTPWIVGRVSADRSWVEGDGCESDVSVRMKYHPLHGGLETTIRQPDDLAPPRSDEDRRAEVLESHVFFDAYGNLESTIERDLDGNERVTKLHYAYPGATFASAAENTLGHTVKAHFHPELGAPFAIVDPNGLIERTSFDGFGRVVGGSSATGDSFTVRYERRDGDPVPLRVHTSTAGGSRAAQGMNAAGQVVWSEWRELRNALPVTVRALRRYDAAGRVVEESEPFFEGESATHWTQHEYDDVGTLRVAQSPAGRFTYRRTPDRRMATDALGFETTLVLDGRGNVVQGIEPAPGGTIRHAYCADGRLRQTVDPRGNTTTIEYDTLGRRRYLREPDRGEEWTDYDAFDQVVHTRDAGNRDVQLEYDRLGRLTRRTDVSGKTTWTFDVAPHGLGALASTTSPDGIATEYSYHPNGLLESEKLYADSVTLKLSYGYDAFGRPETIESPVMRTRAEYAAGMLLHVRNAATGASLWQGRTYNARGDLREERFGNGLVATREYQPGTGRLTRQLVRRSTTRLQDWTYGHDANGRVTSRRDALNSFQESYDFDPLGRLTKVTSSHDPTLSLQYDVIGNLTWASDVGTLSYDGTSKPHAVRGFRGVEQQYDSVGNHLGDATRRRVEYNALDLPNNILRRADGRSIQIRYDAEGNRAATHGPDGDRYYLGPVEMRGGVFVHRVQVGGRTVAQAMRKDGTTQVGIAYVHDDHLGSTDLVTDASGNVQARFSYDAWGGRKTRAWTSSPAGPDGTPLVDHGYTGHEHDDEWGVIHMRGRAYDPAMRRMTGVDPFVVNPFGVQAFNRYSYVLNDPINNTDPTGFVVNLPPCEVNLCTIEDNGTSLPTVTALEPATITPTPSSELPSPVPGPGSTLPSPVASEPEASEPSRVSLPNMDSVVHRATQFAINALDRGTVWGNPNSQNVIATAHRAASGAGGPAVVAGEFLIYSQIRGTLENVETASDANASIGARAAASGWLLLDVLGGALVGRAARLVRGIEDVVNIADDAANAIYRMANSRFGILRSTGTNTWRSSGGLVYGPDKVFGNRVQHVLAHTVPDATKPMHSVFNVGRNRLLGLIDEAWSMRGAPVAGDPGAFVVPMGRVIGTAGETAIRIVVRPGTNQILTAYPVIP